jgi:prepilin-type N-terminal cleavage/methylation domain-containing protein
MDKNRKNLCPETKATRSGFTLLEVLIASAILTVVAVGLLGMFAQAVLAMKYSEDDLIAREKGREALEMILSAKTTGQLTWGDNNTLDTLENTSSTNGVFLGGGSTSSAWQPLLMACSSQNGTSMSLTSAGYGLIGTCSDSSSDYYILPGSAGHLNDVDAKKIPLSNFQRNITISPVTINSQLVTTLRLITVQIEYPMHPSGWRVYSVSTYISEFR